MGAFSTQMRQVAIDLCTELGNSCVLTKVTAGAYNPDTGNTSKTEEAYPTYSAQNSKFNAVFGQSGQNTNLTAFDNESVVVPWFGQMVDATWLYNGQNILNVEPVESQNEVIIFNITVGEKS